MNDSAQNNNQNNLNPDPNINMSGSTPPVSDINPPTISQVPPVPQTPTININVNNQPGSDTIPPINQDNSFPHIAEGDIQTPTPPPPVINGNVDMPMSSSGPNPNSTDGLGSVTTVEPSFIPTYPKSGSNAKRWLGAVAGLMVLVLAVVVGVNLTGKNQNPNSKATSRCSSDISCDGYTRYFCPDGQLSSDGGCQINPDPGNVFSSNPGFKSNYCGTQQIDCVYDCNTTTGRDCSSCWVDTQFYDANSAACNPTPPPPGPTQPPAVGCGGACTTDAQCDAGIPDANNPACTNKVNGVGICWDAFACGGQTPPPAGCTTTEQCPIGNGLGARECPGTQDCVVRDGQGESTDPSTWTWGCRNDPACIPQTTPTPHPSATPVPNGPPIVSALCTNNKPTATVTWDISTPSIGGYWIDVSETSDFAVFWNYFATTNINTASIPSDFKQPVANGTPMPDLQPNKTYYVRVWYVTANKFSPTANFTTLNCLTDEEAGRCEQVKIYDDEWNLLTTAQLSNLKTGDIIRVTVSGAPVDKFDKARFTINGTLRAEVTQKKPNTNEYYDQYTIPTGVTTFSVGAQIHHIVLGWF